MFARECREFLRGNWCLVCCRFILKPMIYWQLITRLFHFFMVTPIQGKSTTLAHIFHMGFKPTTWIGQMKSTTPKIKRSESGLGIESPSRSRCHFFEKAPNKLGSVLGNHLRDENLIKTHVSCFEVFFNFNPSLHHVYPWLECLHWSKKSSKKIWLRIETLQNPMKKLVCFGLKCVMKDTISSYPCNERLFIDLLVLLPGLASIAGAEDQFPPQESHPKRAVSDRKLLSKTWLNKFKHQKLPRNFEWMILELWSHWLIQL